MKKKYNTPSIDILDVEVQQIIAISNEAAGTQSLKNVQTSNEELDASSYRSGLWN